MATVSRKTAEVALAAIRRNKEATYQSLPSIWNAIEELDAIASGNAAELDELKEQVLELQEDMRRMKAGQAWKVES